HRHGVDRRVVNASRWPPGAASVHTTPHSAASNNTDRPTPGTGTESIVGWSTPRVGHRARPRCTPHSAAGKTPAALIPPNGRPSGTTAGKLRTLLRFPVSVMPLSNIEILHQDAALLVVNKPTLLLSVPGRAEDNRDCLVTRLQE